MKSTRLPLRGTGDVRLYKHWALWASTHGVATAYRPPPEPAELYETPDYPPLSLGLLASTAHAVQAVFGEVAVDSRLLTFYVKLVVLSFGVLTGLMFWSHARRVTGDSLVAVFIGAAWWLNPAPIVNGSILGYFDAPCMAAGLGALLCAGRGRFVAAAVFGAAAALLKPQGLFFLPALAAAAWGGSQMWRATAAGLGFALAVLVPVALESGPGHLSEALLVNVREDMLSGNALNLWLIVSVGVQWLRHGWEMFQIRLIPVSLTAFTALAGFEPRIWMALLVMGVAAWLGYRQRGRTRLVEMAAYVAFVIHLYFVLAIAVHENHQVYAVVPLLLVAVERRPYRWLAAGVSLISAANMFLFYGGGRDLPEMPRTGPFLVITVLLSLANMGLLVYHWRLFRPIRLESESGVVPEDSPERSGWAVHVGEGR